MWSGTEEFALAFCSEAVVSQWRVRIPLPTLALLLRSGSQGHAATPCALPRLVYYITCCSDHFLTT